MNTLDERLVRIRDKLDGEYYKPWSNDEPKPNIPLPARSSELSARIEYVLNMNLARSEKSADIQGFIKELNRMFFRLKYYPLFAAISLAFSKIGAMANRLRDWADNKAAQYRKV